MKRNFLCVGLLSLSLLMGCSFAGNESLSSNVYSDNSSSSSSSFSSIAFERTMTITAPMDDVTLYVGEQLTLSVSFNFAVSDPLISWSSLDENLASVDSSGLVTALRPGEVVIRAEYEDLSSTITLTILEEEYTEGLEFTLYEEESETGETISYYGVTRYHGTSNEVILPATYNALPVSFINDDAFADNEIITDVYISSNIEYIGYRVFEDCINLKNVDIKKGKLRSLWPYAFNGCTSLEKIFIPETVTYIGWYCFNVCNNLTIFAEASGPQEEWLNDWNNADRPVIYSYAGINFEDNGFSYAVSTDENNNRYCSIYGYEGEKTILNIPGTVVYETQSLPVKYLVHGFEGNNLLEEVNIGENVISLAIDLFSNCGNLEHVSLPSSLEIIEERVFYRNSSLREILIPSNVTSIGEYAFNGNTSLIKAFIPRSVEFIGHNCFFNVPNDLKIYCEGNGEGVNWDETWNYHNVEVIYNASIDDYLNA